MQSAQHHLCQPRTQLSATKRFIGYYGEHWLRAWWCIAYAAFLRCSETAQIRWEDIEVERSDTSSLNSVTVSLAVRDRIVFNTTTETIKVNPVRQEGYLPSSNTAIMATDSRRRCEQQWNDI